MIKMIRIKSLRLLRSLISSFYEASKLVKPAKMSLKGSWMRRDRQSCARFAKRTERCFKGSPNVKLPSKPWRATRWQQKWEEEEKSRV